MPAPFSDRHAVQADILHRLAHGMTLKAICAEPAMPQARTVYGWTWTDPAFDQALATALCQGRLVRSHHFREDQARAFLQRLAAGEPVTRLIRDPAMPNERKLRLWRTVRPDFGAEVARLVKAARIRRAAALAHRLRPAYRPWTEAEGDRVLVRLGRGETLADLGRAHRADPTLPPPWLVRLWRRENPQFDHDVRINTYAGRRRRPKHAAHRRRDAIADRVIEAIIEGASFNDLDGQDGFPTRRTLGRWVRQDPDFAARIAQACHDREEGLIEQAIDLVGAGPMTAKALRQRVGPVMRRAGSLRVRPGMRRRAEGRVMASKGQTAPGYDTAPNRNGRFRCRRVSSRRQGQRP